MVKSKKKGKRKESSSAQHRPKEPLPHEEEAGPSGFGTANEDYNTLTEEYLQAAENIGYDGKVKDPENEGPLEPESKQHYEETPSSESSSPLFAVGDEDEFRNVWGGDQHARPEGRHIT